MANRIVELVARISADVSSDVEDKFDGVGNMAKRMADDVEDSTARGAGGLDRMGSASEGLDDKFGRAAGAAGALSSGADLIGNEKASAGLQAIALATDFFSGVGQVGILVTEGLGLAQAKAAAESKAAAAVTKAQAGAQAALNLVMSANPILLVVIALAALVGGFILAYKHSETVREIVQKFGKAGAVAIHAVTDAVGDVIDWLGRVISKFGVVGDAVHFYVFIIKTEIGAVVDIVKFVVDKVEAAGHVWGGFKDKAVDAARTLVDKVGGFFHNLLKPIDVVSDAIHDLFDLIGDLVDKLTHLPKLPFGLGSGSGAQRSPTPALPAASPVTLTIDMPVTINLPIAGDPALSAQAIVAALVGLADRLGVTVIDLLTQAGVVSPA